MFILIQVIELVYWVLTIAILARVLLSWVRLDRYPAVANLVIQITEPILAPIRRLLPATAGLDFSPFIAIIALDIIRRLLIGLLG